MHARSPETNGAVFAILWKIASGTNDIVFVTVMKAIAPVKHRTSIGNQSSFETAVNGFCLTIEDKDIAPIRVIDVLMKLISHTVTLSSLNCTSLSKACMEQ